MLKIILKYYLLYNICLCMLFSLLTKTVGFLAGYLIFIIIFLMISAFADALKSLSYPKMYSFILVSIYYWILLISNNLYDYLISDSISFPSFDYRIVLIHLFISIAFSFVLLYYSPMKFANNCRKKI